MNQGSLQQRVGGIVWERRELNNLFATLETEKVQQNKINQKVESKKVNSTKKGRRLGSRVRMTGTFVERENKRQDLL